MMKKKNKHGIYTALLYKIGLRTSLLQHVFALPLTISCVLALLCCTMMVFPFARGLSIGILSSCVTLIFGVQLVYALLEGKRSRIVTLLFMHGKVIASSLLLVMCYHVFHLSIFALLLGFITPLCILTIHLCKVYLPTKTIKEL